MTADQGQLARAHDLCTYVCMFVCVCVRTWHASPETAKKSEMHAIICQLLVTVL
jgi:hypothetical protein